MDFKKINHIYKELDWVTPLDRISKDKLYYHKNLTKEQEETPFFWLLAQELFASERKEKLITNQALIFIIKKVKQECSKESYHTYINYIVDKSIENEQTRLLKLIKEHELGFIKEEHLYKCVFFGAEKSFNFLLKDFKNTEIFDNYSFKDALNNPSSSNPLVVSIINNDFGLFKKIYTLKNEPGCFYVLNYLLPKTEECDDLRYSIFSFLSKKNRIWVNPKYSPFKSNIRFFTKEEMCSYIDKEYRIFYPKSVMAIYYSYEDIKRIKESKILKKEFLKNKKDQLEKTVSISRF